MTAREALSELKVIKDVYAGMRKEYEPCVEALSIAINALEKEVWREEHPVSPLHLKKHSDPPTEDNSCMYCNKRMSCYRYITWLGDPLDLFAPKVNGCDKFVKNKN